jgi:uncharacterized membrane-anchored protein
VADERTIWQRCTDFQKGTLIFWSIITGGLDIFVLYKMITEGAAGISWTFLGLTVFSATITLWIVYRIIRKQLIDEGW